MAAGERKLLPAVRGAPDDAWIVASGFSCRLQIDHLQDRRRALHIAELLAMADGGVGPSRDGPVEQRMERGAAPRLPQAVVAGALAATATLGVMGSWLAGRWSARW